MPDGVPDGVAAAFTGLIPAAVILTCGVIIYHICVLVSGVTPVELIYKFLQAPLQNLGDSFVGVMIIEGLIPFLWWFGVHGATVVGSVATPIADANMLTNAEIFENLINQGMSRADAVAAMGANGAHIFTNPFRTCFHAITGSGLLCIGWQGALWQIVCLAASFFIYLPFARSVDNELYEMEQAGEQA